MLTRFEKHLDFFDFISKINAQKPFYEIRIILNKIKDSIETRINNESKVILFNENDVAFVTTRTNLASKEMQQVITDHPEFNHFIFMFRKAELNSEIIAKGKNIFIFGKVLNTRNDVQIIIDLSGKNGETIKGYADD